MSQTVNSKKTRGQFYTTNCDYILDGMTIPKKETKIIEPFAGMGDLIKWAKQKTSIPIEAYDIDPKYEGTQQQDTLLNPPVYTNAWVLTNPPYLARNKNTTKELYEKYNTNDLYKCFINTLLIGHGCSGGIMIIPSGFFFSPRDLDVKCRNDFMKHYRIKKVRYFEETVFADTSTTVVAILFEKSKNELTEQKVKWTRLPMNETKVFHMCQSNNWIIGGEIYNLPISKDIHIRRYVEGQSLRENEQQTFMTINSLDSGKEDGRINLNYKKDYVYPAKECSRTYATLRISGIELNEQEQIDICKKFNEYIEEKRKKTWSLFLPQFRESKEYARKRLPFELAYRIVNHIILSSHAK